MVEVIPTLINVISMIHNISRYYNTSQRMTSLFIKVTNQMVTACRKYITENGRKRIWDQESTAVKMKIKVGLHYNWLDVVVVRASVSQSIDLGSISLSSLTKDYKNGF